MSRFIAGVVTWFTKYIADRPGRTALLCLLGILIPGASMPARSADPPDAGSLSEELPRIPAIEPDQALQTFQVQQGFTLQLVASEPQVSDPVDACFDADGRMYVAEMHGYPFSQEPTKLNPAGGGRADAGIIRLLEDTDGDGRMDVSVKFADGIRWPTSVACWQDGVFVLAPPCLWYFRDTDGDRVADIRQVIYDGFNRDNVQAIANNMKWGLDHRIYAAGASNPTVITRGGQALLPLGGKDFSFHPRTFDVRHETGGVQFGHSFDDWGHRFVCSNSNHIQQVVFPWSAVSRNPDFPVSGPIRSIAKEGAAAPVFRRSSAEPWRIVRTRRRVADPRYAGLPATEKVPIGFFTSATSVTMYRGDAWPEEYRGQAFIGDVGGNLVHRKLMHSDGVSSLAERADAGVEFIASTDNWFRPTNFVNAPDGTLYVLDMYRETIEHPYSIPDDIKSHLDLQSGDDRGRIYRIVGPNGVRRAVEPMSKLPVAELVSRLASKNAWVRETAHRLIFERQDAAAIEPLRELLTSSPEPLGRMHALWSLQGLAVVTASDVQSGLRDADAGVREQAARCAELFAHSPQAAGVMAALEPLTRDSDQRVRFQTALTLGAFDTLPKAALLRTLITADDSIADVQTAAMTSVGSELPDIVFGCLEDQDIVARLQQPGGSALRSWFQQAVRSLTSRRDSPATRALFEKLADDSLAVTVKRLLMLSIADGLNQHGATFQTTLATTASAATQAAVGDVLMTAIRQAGDVNQPVAVRTESLKLVALAPADDSLPLLQTRLSPAESGVVQLAALEALDRHPSEQVASTLIEQWRSLSPQVRSAAASALVRTVSRTEQLLAAIEAGQVQPPELDPGVRQILTGHPNAKIRERATALLGKNVASNRAEVVEKYQSSLELTGDAERGLQLFRKNCIICHKVGQEGHNVGPEIASVQNKSPADLVIAILDPNREAQPAFTGYTLITKSGQVLNGLISADTAASITIRRAEGKESTVPRGEIDELVSTGRTLMPEGFEKELNPQQLADVIAFLKSLGQPGVAATRE